ncbi:MAG TPA: xanthine dehydrogenase family protein molybdopterin-binding subunit [Candidatus Limnocylindria bacterium]|jgi:xanthine dehydrogenase YagR molybdenum-binding subunit|nr:xanthine dehydrogenase family protein molybdopterin-binding subunit [Candidatus Limnocylindria bacterium]
MPRVVKSREEFEGEIFESLVLVEGKDLPLPAAGAEFTEIGHGRRRVDGTQRVTGRARYTQDIYLPGMLHVRVLRSPYPRARVRRIDTKKAEALPGVRGVLHRFNAPKAAFRGEETIFREEVRFVGEEVAAVAADDEQIAVEALGLIEVDYELLPHVVDLEEAIGDVAPRLESDGNVSEGATHKRGDVKRALKEADHVVEATYRTSTQLHNSLETHGAVAAWDGEQLTVYESTQHVFGVRQGLRLALRLPLAKIRVICDYMGGGFGSKGGVGKYSIIASLFAMRLGRPIRCVLTREEENVAAGNRSATLQHMRLAGKDGRITAIEHTSWANVGQGKWVANPTGPTNTLYDVSNLSSKSYKVVTNAGSLSAFRAPGYVEGTFALESAIDELAATMGVDPITLRRKHAGSPKDPMVGKRYSDKHLLECYRIGAAEIGWQRRRSGGTRGSAPHRRRGIGMATQIWGGGGGPPAYATVHVNSDGTAVLTTGTQDIGTGTRTVLAQICADELGFELEDVHVRLGDTDNPYGPISAGSLTVASVGPAVRIAARDAREQLLGAAAGVLETPKSELRLASGVVVTKGARTPLSEILSKVDNNTVIGKGGRHPNDPDLSLRTFGAHFVELEVDVRTGEITVEHVVAVHDIGRILNPTTARSQVEGGVLQALGFALSEERFVDRATGRVMNANLENYKVPTVKDVPAKITVKFVDRPDRRANNLGVKGLGEPPIIPTAAAIANAVANATGARVRHAPLTRARVLEALAIAGARS